jgi:hypothetical protein
MSSQAHLSKSAPLPGPGHQARYPASYPGTTAWRCRPGCPWFPVDFRPSTPCFRSTSMVPSSTRPAFALWTSCSRQQNSVFLTVDLPSRSQTARTLPGLPCSARMRHDRGGRLLYSGAVVSFRPAMGLWSAPAVSQRLALSSTSRTPSAEVTITKHPEIHLHSPVRPSPRPPSPDGTATASAFALGFAPRGYPQRTPERGRSRGHWTESCPQN